MTQNLRATQLQIPSRPPSPKPPQTIPKPSRPHVFKSNTPFGIWRLLTHESPSPHAAPRSQLFSPPTLHSDSTNIPYLQQNTTLSGKRSLLQYPGRMIRPLPSHLACHSDTPSVFNLEFTVPKHDYHQYKFYQLKWPTKLILVTA